MFGGRTVNGNMRINTAITPNCFCHTCQKANIRSLLPHSHLHLCILLRKNKCTKPTLHTCIPRPCISSKKSNARRSPDKISSFNENQRTKPATHKHTCVLYLIHIILFYIFVPSLKLLTHDMSIKQATPKKHDNNTRF